MKRLSSRTIALASCALAAAMLAGCAGASAGAGFQPLTPTQRFSLQVEPGLDRIALAVHETGVSPGQDAAIGGIVDRFQMEGAPVLRVEAPSGNDPVSNDFAWRVKAALEQRGAGGRVQVVSYEAPDPRAPVLVGYETVRASVPQCGAGWTDLSRTAGNEGSANFGCAVTANLAAQIANPRDIVTPRTMTQTDAGRRAVVFDKYRKGEATAAITETLIENQRASQAVD